MHAKIVARVPGSSWCVAYNTVIFAHADLVKMPNGEAQVIYDKVEGNLHSDDHADEKERRRGL